MDRRTFIGRVTGGLLAGSRIADAQQVGSIPVVGVLINNAGRSAGSSMLRAFDQGLRDLGYVDGKNIIVDIRSAGGKPEALPRLAAELTHRKVDVIYAAGPGAIQATRDATSVIPIIALDLESDPVLAGWAKSLARPGGNLSGLFVDLPGLAGKWLELVKAAAPGIRRVGVLWDSTTGTAQLVAAKAAAPGFALDLHVMEVRSDEDVGAALTAGVSAGSRALVLLSSPAISGQQKEIAEFTLKNQLPAISPFRNFADAGGLIAYGPDFNELRRRAASYVVKVLKGAKIGDLPIERPTKFEMVVNLKTARKMGLTIPQSLLLRADEVIQ